MSTATHSEALPGRRPFAMPGWAVTTLALVVLVAAVAAGVVIGYNSAPEATTTAESSVRPATEAPVSDVGLAPPAKVAAIDSLMEAWSDGKVGPAQFTRDAVVINEIAGYQISGLESISEQAAKESASGIQIFRLSPVVDTLSRPTPASVGHSWLAYTFGYNAGSGIVVLRLGSGDKVAEMRVLGRRPG